MTFNGPSRSSSLIITRSEKVASSRSTRIRHLRYGSNSSRRSPIRIISLPANLGPIPRPRTNTVLELRVRTSHKHSPASKATLRQQDRLIRQNLNVSKSSHDHLQPLRLGLSPDYRFRTPCQPRGMPTMEALAISMGMTCTDDRCLDTDFLIQPAPLGQLRLHTMEQIGQSSELTQFHHL
jgi:hypothetical protein